MLQTAVNAISPAIRAEEFCPGPVGPVPIFLHQLGGGKKINLSQLCPSSSPAADGKHCSCPLVWAAAVPPALGLLLLPPQPWLAPPVQLQ